MPYKTMKTPQEREMEDRIRKHEAAKSAIQTSAVEDPRIDEAQKTLGVMLADYRERNPAINRNTGRDMQKLVDDFRGTCLHKGIELPKLRLVYFVRMNHVCVWPAEMEHAELQKRLHLFIAHRQRHGRAVDADDMAMGVRRAYPDYSPSRHLILPPNAHKSNQQETMQ